MTLRSPKFLSIAASLLCLPLTACGSDSSGDGDTAASGFTSLPTTTGAEGTDGSAGTESSGSNSGTGDTGGDGDTATSGGDGDSVTSGGDGDSATSGDGDSATSGDGDSATSGDGDSATSGDGDSATSGDGDSATSGDGDSAGDGDGDGDLLCPPGDLECVDADTYHECAPDGMTWLPDVDCDPTEQCLNGNCISKCEIAGYTPSSVGCSFVAHHMDNFDDLLNDSIIVGNFSETQSANVNLYVVNQGTNTETLQSTVSVAPGATQEFSVSTPVIDGVSSLVNGGVYRVESDIPVVAYQHSPIGSDATNDASMLIPETAQGSSFVIASYASDLPTYTPYLNIIGLEDGTTVNWTPPAGTQAGAGVPAVAAGATGTITLNRFDRVQIIPTFNTEIAGTVVTADQPVAVWGAAECMNVPAGVTFCDHIEEQMLPLVYWGTTYVGAHAPQRGNEDFHWRVFAGEDGVTINTDPAQPGFPVTLNQGQYQSLVTTQDVVFTGDGAFMPVQYLEGENGGAGTGDPSMYQMVPVGQFLSAYTFATGISSNYPYTHYVQVTRLAGGADVLVDGQTVGNYRTVGNYEVSDWPVSEGSHFATSSQAFGITGVGYADVTSYAYPGGMNLLLLNPE